MHLKSCFSFIVSLIKADARTFCDSSDWNTSNAEKVRIGPAAPTAHNKHVQTCVYCSVIATGNFVVVPASSANVRSAAVSNGELNLIPLLVASKQRPDYNKRVSIDSTSYLPATLELVFYLGFPQGRDCCWCIASLGLPRLRRPTTPVTFGRKDFWLYRTAIACQTVGCSLSFSTIIG